MFKYNEEMKKAIKEELLGYIKFRVFVPNKNGNPLDSSEDESKMSPKKWVAFRFEQGLYRDIIEDYDEVCNPYPAKIETNDTSKAKDVAKAVYNKYLNYELKKRIGGKKNFEWYLSLPPKQFNK